MPPDDRASPCVVVTGLGAVTPFGWGVDAFDRGLREGRAAIEELFVFEPAGHRTRLAGQVPEPRGGTSVFLDELLPCRRRRMPRSSAFALAAAREACAQAGLDLRGSDAGIFFGSSTGGMFEGEQFCWELLAGTTEHVRTTAIVSQQNNAPTDTVARELGLGGPSVTLASACSAASMALEAALDSLRSGETEVALAGGADTLCQLTYAGFNSLRAVDEGPSRPFRGDRGGLSIGEGAGVLVLETEAHARARGATVLAELSGAGSSCDAHHMTAPDPEGAGIARAIHAALADAGLAPEDVDFVNAHGTGTPLNDVAEWKGLARVFGERAGDVPLTATKGAIGHLLGACGSVEAVATVLSLSGESVPATPGSGPVGDDCPARVSFGAPIPLPPSSCGLSINMAFGGANAAVLFRTYDRSRARPRRSGA